MKENFSIKVYKQYFNFASAHFLLFEDGSREPLHGHNYRVQVKGHAPKLKNDMVFDFLDIKPIVRKVCDSLDHKVLLPADNKFLKIHEDGLNYICVAQDESVFSFPRQDVLLLPIHNTSAERLAIYLAHQINDEVKKTYQFHFSHLEIEVEETPGQSAIFVLEEK